ncbi:MAG TPA: phosphonopyruvate decarboxylase [Ignavibacteria bacterium]|nr:phosphonopyruvate decarboxylase [Ignavibacteria bacterium]HMR38838.1 phosphonopyruvate decarboxylase [Ignavibacteria bacterium]
MIRPEDLFNYLKTKGIDFYTGVPDSLLKNFCSYVTDNSPVEKHIINSNEGAAVALASGHYLSTGKPALVYMQNSGLGNSINPLLSLADPEVYGIPMLLMIGWRGEPGKKDEPQHIKQGKVMLSLLDSMGIRYEHLTGDTGEYSEKIDRLIEEMFISKSPVALIISDGTFENYDLNISENEKGSGLKLRREDAVKLIIDNISEKDVIVSTTGKASREVFEYRESKGQGHQNDFLTVGSMGHCSQIALGIAIVKKDLQIFILDGDGAVIMQMGSLAISGSLAPENLKHIVINNGAHDSVGGQPTAGFEINFPEIAKACGYRYVSSAEEAEDITFEINKLKKSAGPSFLEIKVNKGARKDLGRPTTTPHQNKESFMNNLMNK